MTIEEKIIQAISESVEDERLQFQVIIHEQTLLVYINRNTEEDLNYSQLTTTIHSAIEDLQELDFLTMELYGRLLGEIEPDWQTSIKLVDEIDRAINNTQAVIDDIKHELADSSASKNEDSEISEQDLPAIDLSQYCFIRNKGLLNAEIIAPHHTVAELIDTFDKFDLSIKQTQLSLLESYFKIDKKPDIDSFKPEIKSWWTNILALDDSARRKLAIWLSRYCHESENTMTVMVSAIAEGITAKKAEEEKIVRQAREEREARYNININRQNTTDRSSVSSSRSPRKKSSSSRWGFSWCINSIILIVLLRLFVERVSGDLNFHNYTSPNHPLANNSESKDRSNLRIVTQSSNSGSSPVKQLISSGSKKYQQQDYDGALNDLDRAIELLSNTEDFGSSLPVAYNLRGTIRTKLHLYDGAIGDMNKAIKLSPFKDNYYTNRGLAYLGWRDYQLAIADFTRAIQLKPKNSYGYYYRGKAHHEAGDYDLALADLNLAISLNYFTMEAYEQRYYTHRALGNLEKAEADYKQAKYFGFDPQ